MPWVTALVTNNEKMLNLLTDNIIFVNQLAIVPDKVTTDFN